MLLIEVDSCLEDLSGIKEFKNKNKVKSGFGCRRGAQGFYQQQNDLC